VLDSSSDAIEQRGSKHYKARSDPALAAHMPVCSIQRDYLWSRNALVALLGRVVFQMDVIIWSSGLLGFALIWEEVYDAVMEHEAVTLYEDSLLSFAALCIPKGKVVM